MARKHRIHLGDDVREPDFRIGQEVYLRVDDEPTRGLVCGYGVRPNDLIYEVAWPAGRESRHYGFELTDTAWPEPTGEGDATGTGTETTDAHGD
jgi:hypothetical protein